MPDSTGNKLCTAALLTPIGRGAVATIRLVGDFGSTTNDVISSNHHAVISLDSLFRAANGIALGQQPLVDRVLKVQPKTGTHVSHACPAFFKLRSSVAGWSVLAGANRRSHRP